MLTTLVIDRGQWLTGEALRELQGDSCLLHERSSLKCCLGIYLEQLGVAQVNLVGKGMPTDLREEDEQTGSGNTPDEAGWLFKPLDTNIEIGPMVQDHIAATNDSKRFDAAEREWKIASLFKQHGDIEVTFTGDYVAALAAAAHAAREMGYYEAYEEGSL